MDEKSETLWKESEDIDDSDQFYAGYINFLFTPLPDQLPNGTTGETNGRKWTVKYGIKIWDDQDTLSEQQIEEFFHANHRMIEDICRRSYGYVSNKYGESSVAQGIRSAAVLGVFNGVRSYHLKQKNTATLTTYAFQCARNAIRDLWREEGSSSIPDYRYWDPTRVKRPTSLDSGVALDSGEHGSLADVISDGSSDSTFDVFFQNNKRDVLLACLGDCCRGVDRMYVCLFYGFPPFGHDDEIWMETDYTEIAELYHTSRAEVKREIEAAKLRMRKWYADNQDAFTYDDVR